MKAHFIREKGMFIKIEKYGIIIMEIE